MMTNSTAASSPSTTNTTTTANAANTGGVGGAMSAPPNQTTSVSQFTERQMKSKPRTHLNTLFSLHDAQFLNFSPFHLTKMYHSRHHIV